MNIFDQFEQPRALDFSRWNVSEEEYRNDSRLNFHTLAEFHRDPRAFKAGFFNDKEPTTAMEFGSALHAALLTPKEYEDKYAIFNAPINPKTGEAFGQTTKAFKEARAEFDAENVGKTPISQSDADLVSKLIDEFWFHPVAPQVLDGLVAAEQTIQGTLSSTGSADDAVDVKGRIDAYSSRSGLIDVKTTAALDDFTGRDRFRYSLYDFKYIVQVSFYHRILVECYGAAFTPCWFIVFEKNEPNRVAVYVLTRDVIEAGYRTVDAWLDQWNFAANSGQYASKFDTMQIVDKYDGTRDF